MGNKNFYRRKLPDTCIDFTSENGKTIFKRSLQSGYMESYFKLSAQFRTQDEPAYCGLSSLVMVLNALAIDPGKVWKGVFRWYHEDMLDCCAPLEVVKKEGISADKLLCLALCNQLNGSFIHAETSSTSLEKFRDTVKEFCQKDDRAIIVSFGRQILNQTGSGHFSPIAGYDVESDCVLIMDVARFKYPPYWVKTSLLYQAMETFDTDTGLMRGYMLLYTPTTLEYRQPPLLFKLTENLNIFTNQEPINNFFITLCEFLKTEIPKQLTQEQTIQEIGVRVLKASDNFSDNILSLRFTLDRTKEDFPKIFDAIKLLTHALSSTKIYKVLIKTIPEEINCNQKLFCMQAGSCYAATGQSGLENEDACVVCVPHFLSVFLLSLPLDKFNDVIPPTSFGEFLFNFAQEEIKTINKLACDKNCSSNQHNNMGQDDDGVLPHGTTLLRNELQQIKTQLNNILLAVIVK